MRKRLFALCISLIMLVSFAAACGGNGGNESEPAPTAAPESGQTAEPGGEDPGAATPSTSRDLNGLEVRIGDWWTANDAPKRKPQTLRDEQLEDLIFELEAEYGFTINNWGVSGWADYLETFTTSVMAGDPEAEIWIMSGSWAYMLMAQGMLYPLNTLDSIDVYDDKWNSAVTEAYTGADGNVYAISPAKYVEPRNFLFYNKRLFQEAGIDPEEPYNLQKSGEWTWSKLLEYCAKLARDTDGDGTYDIYALSGHWPNVQAGFIYSNNARHVGIDSDGKFYNAMLEPNFIEAMQFVQDLYDDGYYFYSPDPVDLWDWSITTGFPNGLVGMFIYDAHIASTYLDMDDDWGMVFVPKGPRADDYNTYFSENVFVLPFNTPKEKAEDFMYAYNLYTQPLPYDLANPEYWKDTVWGYSRYKDARAVDDTLTMLYEGRMELDSKTFIDPGDNWWGRTYDWNATQNVDESVIEKIEAAAPIVNARIEEVNKGG